jgi:hypothetical protein
VVWFDALPTKGVTDFKVQTYRGTPVLTWWQGTVAKGGHADEGGYQIVDSSYKLIKVVRAGNGLTGDIHDFQLTPNGTALMTIFEKTRTDLTSVGGPRDGYVLEGVVQEVSVATGKVLFEWHSLDHVAPSESYAPLGAHGGLDRTPYDYFHINAISLDGRGNLLVSARHTSAIYEVRKSDGKVLWRLGGKRSDFTFGPGATFAYQHDVRRQPDGTISLFDNAARASQKAGQSRVLRLRVDVQAHRATLVHAYAHDPPILAPSQGNGQFLPDGHVFVGWGQQPYFTEFSDTGKTLLDGRFGGPHGTSVDSYRAFRFPWSGHPTTKPAAVAETAAGATTVYASWNGATDVAGWRVLGGDDAQHLVPVGSAVKQGFETAIRLDSPAKTLVVRAVDARGAVVGEAAVH